MQAFASMEEVLLGAPMLASTANLTRADLHRRWADWKKEVSRRKNAGDYMCCTQLELLARVRGVAKGGVAREGRRCRAEECDDVPACSKI